MSPVDPILIFRSLDTMCDLALIYDRHSRRIYMNKAAQGLGESGFVFECSLGEVFRTRSKVVAQHFLVCGEERRRFEAIYTPILGDNGSPQFVIAIARDVGAVPTRSLDPDPGP